MKKSATLLVLFLIPALASALAVQSCTGGESTGSGSGGNTGTGGKPGGGTGGFTNTGTGGFTNTGTGGITNTGTGGITNTGTGGMVGGGTGGMIGGGTGGMIGGGTGGVAPGGGLAVSVGGFASNGTWMGYAFTGTYPAVGSTATISPASFSTALAGAQLCAMGTVGMAAPGASGAFVGWNLSQIQSSSTTSPPVLMVTPTLTGLVVNLSASVPGARIAIQDNSGTQWCYQAPAPATAIPTSNMIPWAMFNTMCYNTAAGMVYAKQPIAQVQVLIPSSTVATPFSFCLLDVHQY